MANPKPTEPHLRIPHSISEAIMMSSFTKRQRNIIDLILRLSWGCDKKTATIPRKRDFEVLGIAETHVGKELKQLMESNVIFIEGNNYSFNKSYNQWTVPKIKPSVPNKLTELLRLNLNGTYRSGKSIPQELTKTGTNNLQSGILYGGRSPKWAQTLLPSWVRIVDSLDQCPNNCFILIDETGLQFLSLKFADKRNVDLRQQLMLCRQKNWTVVFCAQSSRDIDESIVRQSNCTIYKEPGLTAANSERREVQAYAIKATRIFKQISKEERQRVACVFDENFEGIIKCNLPIFWSEKLSNAYGYVSSSDISGQNANQRIYHSTPGNKPRLSSTNVSDEEILELSRKGYGYEKIAKTLGCTVYRVRKCLAGQDPLDES